MAIIENPNDIQNMFSKAGKITSEKYIVFQRKEEIINNRPRYFKGKSASQGQDKAMEELNQQEKKITDLLSPKQKDNKDPKLLEQDKVTKGNAIKLQQPFTKQLSRSMAHYTKISNDEPPPCGYYHPKYNELDKAPHLVPSYSKTLIKTIPKEVLNKHGNPDDSNKPLVDRPRYKRDCFSDMFRQTQRPDIFAGRPQPHEERFNFLAISDAWSKIPRTPSMQIKKQMARDEMMIYKRKHYAPDYQPNFEFGRKQLGSCGASFDKLEKRKDIMTKIPAYTNEAYFEFDTYSRSPQSQLFRTPTAPNFNKMLERECDGNSLLPSFMQKFSNNRMGITFLHQKMLEVNNFRDGRFQTVTSSFGVVNKQKKKKKVDESSEEELDQEEQP